MDSLINNHLDFASSNLDSSLFFQERLKNLLTLNKKPLINATIRQSVNDFQVNEELSFETSGEGEHLFLLIEKRQCNTDWVAKSLQQYFQLRSQDIGYAGKKDKHAITRQWFSCHLPGKNIDVELLEKEFFSNENLKLIELTRHNKKLRKGSVLANHFTIKLTNLSGEVNNDTIDKVIKKLKTQGFPNYFGYQRFGHNAENLSKANLLLTGKIKIRSKNKKGLYLSAARSFLFNQLLSERIHLKNFTTPVSGDCFNINGSQSYFYENPITRQTIERLTNGEIHISGNLTSQKESATRLEARKIESDIESEFPEWIKGFQHFKMSAARRAFRVIPQNLIVNHLAKTEMLLQFSLPSGSFATSLLREIVNLTDAKLKEFNRD